MNSSDCISFLKRAPPITIVGVVGDEGKTTTAYMIHEILRQTYPPPKVADEKIEFTQAPSVFWLDSENDLSLLIKRVKREDIVIIELDTVRIAEFDDAGISVQIVVCTNILPASHGKEALHAEDQARILKRQTSNNFIVVGEDTFSYIKKAVKFGIKGKPIFKKAEDVPRTQNLHFQGYHNKENISLALGCAELFKVDTGKALAVLENLTPLPGRLQCVKKIRGVEIYNDASSKTPASALAALRTLSHNRNVVLIMGGRDAGFDARYLLPHIDQYANGVVLLEGTGTLKIHRNILNIATLAHAHAQNLEEAVGKGMDMARDGDVLLFSPAFGAVSETDRSEEFLRAVENIV